MENINLSTTPADEVVSSTPADEVVSSTPVNEVVSSTPVNETVSSTPVNETVSSTPVNETDTAINPIPAAGNGTRRYLPKNYLADGYYATTDTEKKYLRPEFVGEYATIMAGLLAEMKPSHFNRLILEMKRSKKHSLPFEARMTAALELLPKAIRLVSRKKAPPLLISFVKGNIDHIHNDDDWMAFFRHLEAIHSYMSISTL